MRVGFGSLAPCPTPVTSFARVCTSSWTSRGWYNLVKTMTSSTSSSEISISSRSGRGGGGGCGLCSHCHMHSATLHLQFPAPISVCHDTYQRLDLTWTLEGHPLSLSCRKIPYSQIHSYCIRLRHRRVVISHQSRMLP